MALATEQGFAHWASGGNVHAGLGAGRQQGQGEEGMAQMRQGLAAWRATGQRWHWPDILPCWPRRMGSRPGRGGLRLLAEALAVVDTGERWLGSRVASAQGRATAAAGRPGRAPGGSLLPAGSRRRPPPAGQVVGAAGGHEPESPVAAAGQARRSP